MIANDVETEGKSVFCCSMYELVYMLRIVY